MPNFSQFSVDIDSQPRLTAPAIPDSGMADAVTLGPDSGQSGVGAFHSGAAISASASADAFGTARS